MMSKKKNLFFVLGFLVLTGLMLLNGCDTTVKEHSLTILINPEDAGTASGAGEYKAGTNVNLGAAADEGFVFHNWTVDGGILTTDNSFEYTMPDTDITLTANFYETIAGETAWTAAEHLEDELIDDLGDAYYNLLDLAPWIAFPSTPNWLDDAEILYSERGPETDFVKTVLVTRGQVAVSLIYEGETGQKYFSWSGEGEFTVNEELNEEGELTGVTIENSENLIEITWPSANELELEITTDNDYYNETFDWEEGEAAENSLLQLTNYINQIEWDPANIIPAADRPYIMLAVGAMDEMRDGPILGVREPWKSIIKNILTGGVGTLINHI